MSGTCNSIVYLLSCSSNWECHEHLYCGGIDQINKSEKQAENKQLNCNVCSKILSTKQGLLVHMRIHSKEKLFKCEICDKRFTRSSNLQDHLRI